MLNFHTLVISLTRFIELGAQEFDNEHEKYNSIRNNPPRYY